MEIDFSGCLDWCTLYLSLEEIYCRAGWDLVSGQISNSIGIMKGVPGRPRQTLSDMWRVCVSLCVCVCIYIYIYIYIYIHVCMYILCTCVCVYMCVCVYVCMYVCTYIIYPTCDTFVDNSEPGTVCTCTIPCHQKGIIIDNLNHQLFCCKTCG